MEVVPLSPMPAAGRRYQPQPGAWALLVVCKATFALSPAESSFAPYQEELNEHDRYLDDDEVRSLYAICDFVPAKRRTDVLLVGHVFARGGVPVHSLTARLVVGDIDKSVEVFCERAFTQEGALLQGSRFTHLPLAYERAAGGPDTWNPVGMRRDARDHYGNVAVPNLQVPGKILTSRDETIEPIGFGPIAPTWPWRRDKLGRHAGTFSHRDWDKAPLPQDISAAYFNAAPLDQQAQALRDNERIVLEHLNAEHPRLITSLPGIHPRAFVEGGGAQGPRELAMRCDTLWIDTDRAICTMTWRGQLPLSRPDERGRVLIALEERGQRLSWDDVQRQLGDLFETQDGTRGENTLDLTDGHARPALPFTAGRVQLAPELTAPRAAPTSFAALRGSPTPSFGAPPAIAPPATQSSFGAPPAIARPATPVSDRQAPPVHEPLSPWATGMPSAALDAPPLRLGALSHPMAPPAPPPPTPAHVPSIADDMPGLVALVPTAGAVWTPQRSADVPPPRPSATESRPPPAEARPQPRPAQRDVLDLIFFEPKSLPRIRKKPAWQKLLDALEDKPLDPDLDDPALAKELPDIEDRREIFEVLVHGDAADGEGVSRELTDAIRDDGRFVAPIILVTGELVFPFQELEALRVTVATAAPLGATDERLQKAVDAAKDFLKTTEPPGLPPLAEGLATRIREAYAQGRYTVSPDYLTAHIERALLEQRAYQRRDVFGERHIRAQLHAQGAAPLTTYLPDSAAKQLPMFQRFKARLIVEVQLAVEQQEGSAAALRVVALARTVPLPQRR